MADGVNENGAGTPLLEVEHLRKEFSMAGVLVGRDRPPVRAVDDVSFSIDPGETFGLVGESGCGKTTLGRVILQLTPATGGQVRFDGRIVSGLEGGRLHQLRQQMQAVFQDPLGSLNPRMKIGQLVGEPVRVFGTVPRTKVEARVAELLRMVGLDPSKAAAYPRELSGGQRQRVGIARAISVNPRFIVADEPVSALDVSVQAQILNLLVELQEQLGLTYLVIAHGLAVVRHMSRRVGVMYLGRMVELATSEAMFAHPAHPYTAALLAAAPVPDPSQRKRRIMLSGELPSAAHLPSGCRFRTRCPLAQARCAEEEPLLRQIRTGQWAACHFAEAVEATPQTVSQAATGYPARRA
jgi:oligopeptide/dipeptide ABC transporter ATP-binding protein